MIHRIVLFAALFIMLAATNGAVQAQPNFNTANPPQTSTNAPSVRFGVVGAFGLNQHAANFLGFRDPRYWLFLDSTARNDGPRNFAASQSTGFAAGVLVEIPFSYNLAVSLRASYAAQDAAFTTFEAYPTGQQSNGASSNGGSEYALKATLRSVALEPALHWSPFASAERPSSVFGGLFVGIGARLGTWIQAVFSQQETLVSDLDGSFEPNAAKRVRSSITNEAIPNIERLQAAALLTLGYDIPIATRSGTIFITPELSYTFAVTGVAKDLASAGSVATLGAPVAGGTWAAHQARAGIALKFAPIPVPPPKEEPREPRPVPPAPKPEKPLLAASVRVAARSFESAKELNEAMFYVRERGSRSLCPLLPYIFFDNAENTRIPDRYALLTPAVAQKFNPNALQDGETLKPNEHQYYHLLNIIGERMRRFPKATLTLTGCVDGASPGERGRTDIAQLRADVVQRYLLNTWGVALERMNIIINDGGVSAKPSVPMDERTKMQENRRVEMSSDTPEILDPLVLEDRRSTISAPALKITPRVEPTNNVARWRVTVRQNGAVLNEFSGNGAPPKELNWNLAEDVELATRIAESPNPLGVELAAWDNTGRMITSPGQTIPVRREELTAEMSTITDRYRLILFDFNSSELTAQNRRVTDMITQLMREGGANAAHTTIKVMGFTDKTGSEEANKRLSLARAKATAAALKLTNADVRGNGSTPTLYDNTLAEGRFYCRTVIVIVEEK